MNAEVVCLGISAADILVSGVTSTKEENHTTFVKSIGINPGGDAVNEAITLSNLGHEVRLMTLVGEDVQGEFLVKACKEQGVDTKGVTMDKDVPTSTSVVMINENGERNFLSAENGSAARYGIENMDLSNIENGVKVLSIASLFCSKNLNEKELTEILKKAKEVGATTIADMVLDRKECSLEDIKGALKYLDYIVPSYDEASYFTGKKELDEIVEVFRGYGIENVVIKLGAEGIYADNGSQILKVGTMADKVVDTTGAGDNFMAGFISGLLRGDSLQECLEFGSAVSAISIGKVGATGAVKNKEQVEEFLKNKKYKGE